MTLEPKAASRLQHLRAELHDIISHEGFRAAYLVMCWRLAAFLRHSLSRFRPNRSKLPPNNQDNSLDINPGVKDGVLFLGYVEASLGLGSSLRNLIGAVASTGIPFAIHPFNRNVESRYIGPFLAEKYDAKSRYQVNVIEMAADQLALIDGNLLHKEGSRPYNILRTYWELPSAPSEWKNLLLNIDEIWAPNYFVADAFRSIYDRSIKIIPPCAEVPIASADRPKFDLEPDKFYFLFTFDYFSFPARKNPVGVVRSFQAAFPKSRTDVSLIIKSTDAGKQFGDISALLDEASRQDPRIVIIKSTLAHQDVIALIASCDCYVSLHRSEGFGLGMVEAMAHGKPVIATDFSGSQDFLTSETGFPVDFTLRPVLRGEYPYGEGQLWAEPNLQSAAIRMRQVVAQTPDVRERAEAGRAFVQARYSKTNVGALAAARLNEIMEKL